VKVPVHLFQDEDAVWIAEVSSIPGCVSQGKTKDEALGNVQDAANQCVAERVARGFPIGTEDFLAIANGTCEYTVEISD